MKPSTASSGDLFRLLLRQVRPYWRVFAIGIVFMTILALSEAGIPALLKPVLDGTFVEKDAVYLAWAPAAIIALFLVRGVASIVNQVAFTYVATRVVFDLRKKMFNRLLHLPTTFYDRHNSGNILSKVTYDVMQVTTASTEVLTVAVKDTIAVIALTIYMFWLDAELASLIFILIPAVAMVATVVGRRLRRITREMQNTQGDLTHVLEEALRGHKSVKMFGAQQREAQRFAAISNWVRRLHMKFMVASSISVPVVEIIGAVIMAVVIYIGTARAEADQLTVGGFVSFFAALGLLFSPIKRLAKINEPLQRGLAAAESVFGLLEEPVERDTGETPWQTPRAELTFSGVGFRYPLAATDALSDIDLTIDAGTAVALVGGSGGGKSTLVALISRLYNPTSGTIRIDGIDTQTLSLRELRSHIALVSQDIALFNDNIAGNIAYGMEPRPDDDAIWEAARAAYADEFIRQLPDGLQTTVGENGVRLSGGQRQRIAIARALLKDAPLLILDEATSALDNESERSVQAALETLRAGRTTLIIAHRLSTVEHADRILVLEKGRVVEDGSHQTLIALDGRYAKLYRSNLEDAPETAE